MNKGRSRANSLSDVLREGRKRAQSITAHEVVDTLKAPISWKLIVSYACVRSRGGSCGEANR